MDDLFISLSGSFDSPLSSVLKNINGETGEGTVV